MADALSVMLDEERSASDELVAATSRELPVVSVLIVTWNSSRWIERCLSSIGPACGDLASEVIVCDNASADDTSERAARSATVIRSITNDGYAAATNRAFAHARGKYLFLLNPDCELPPGSIAALHAFLDRTPRAAAAAPLLVDESGDSQSDFQFRRLPTWTALAAEVFSLSRFFPRAVARYRYGSVDFRQPQRVEQPAGAALLIRREVFESVGPLDEQFRPAWFEDVDYCQRLAVAGKEIWAVPTTPVRHFGGSSLETLSFAEFQEAWYRNMLRYARKWFGPMRAELLRLLIIFSMTLRCAASLAGLAHRHLGRIRAFRAYANVLGKAVTRWDVSSPSSS